MSPDNDLACEGDCNPYEAFCGARFCTHEAMVEHLHACTVKTYPMTDGLTLAHAAAELNAASDAMTALVNRIEARLKEMNLGVTASIAKDGISLSYQKIDGAWHLNIEHEEHVWSFNEAPRNLRIIAIDEIPRLFVALEFETKRLTGVIQAAHHRAEVTLL